MYGAGELCTALDSCVRRWTDGYELEGWVHSLVPEICEMQLSTVGSGTSCAK